MASIIIVEHNASPLKIGKSVEGALALSDDLLIVGDNNHNLEFGAARWVSPRTLGSVGQALNEACRIAKSDRVTVTDARITSFPALKALMESSAQGLSDMVVVPAQYREEQLSFLGFLPEHIIPTIGISSLVALQIFTVEKKITESIAIPLCSQIGWATAVLMEAISRNQRIASCDWILNIDSSLPLEEIARVPDHERALILTRAIAANNIEDLFPRHPWAEHHQESAAASYHSLAALFVRLGDINSAHECLQLSDSLEDSPRSLALKGLIAHEKGEILGAVANLVSSLQQYETRKRNDGQHYLTFLPKDIEDINSKLQAGLDALNRRDNSVAFNHFAAAIFSFDDFYQSYGVDKKALSAVQ
jgi:hypothetical protein